MSKRAAMRQKALEKVEAKFYKNKKIKQFLKEADEVNFNNKILFDTLMYEMEEMKMVVKLLTNHGFEPSFMEILIKKTAELQSSEQSPKAT